MDIHIALSSCSLGACDVANCINRFSHQASRSLGSQVKQISRRPASSSFLSWCGPSPQPVQLTVFGCCTAQSMLVQIVCDFSSCTGLVRLLGSSLTNINNNLYRYSVGLWEACSCKHFDLSWHSVCYRYACML